MPADGQAGAFLAPENDPPFLYIFADELESDRCFKNFKVMQFGHAIDEMGGGDGSSDGAPPAAAFDEIVHKQSQQVVGRNEFGVFVEHAEAIGVTVGGEADL